MSVVPVQKPKISREPQREPGRRPCPARRPRNCVHKKQAARARDAGADDVYYVYVCRKAAAKAPSEASLY